MVSGAYRAACTSQTTKTWQTSSWRYRRCVCGNGFRIQCGTFAPFVSSSGRTSRLLLNRASESKMVTDGAGAESSRPAAFATDSTCVLLFLNKTVRLESLSAAKSASWLCCCISCGLPRALMADCGDVPIVNSFLCLYFVQASFICNHHRTTPP